MKYDEKIKISTNQALTTEGFLVCKNCALATTGGRMYHTSELPELEADADGIVTIFRDSACLFDPKTLASFEGKPITLGHPPGGANVDPTNFKDYAVGTIHGVRRGENEQSDSLVADLLIFDPDVIKAVTSKRLTELSLGYTSIETSEGPGIAYETQMTGNHVAIVSAGRNGPLCSIRDNQTGDIDMAEPTPKDTDKPDIAKLLKGLTEQNAALAARLDKLEKALNDKGDKKPEDKPEDKTDKTSEEKGQESAKRDSAFKAELLKSVANTVRATMQEEKQKEQVTQAVIRDAAIIAPGLAKDTPDLALAALQEYAKTENGSQILAEYGGITSVKRDEAPAVLKSIAIIERQRNSTRFSVSSKRDEKPQKPDFFEQAKALWGKE